MSHGHLSKVERGEPGRPVTPKVLFAYEKATGIQLTGAAGHEPPEHEGGWRRGHLSEGRRRALNAKVAAVAVGGPLGDQLMRILDATGRITAPPRIEIPDVVQVEQAAALCTKSDLRCGGEVADQLARALLRWAIGLLETGIDAHIAPRLHAAIGCLAQRAGWAAFDADDHEIARALFTIALYSATRADDADLRAHVIADLAAQYNFLGYPDDALQIARFGSADERIGPAVRMVLAMVKARAYAALGGVDAYQQQIELAQQAHAQAATASSTVPTRKEPDAAPAGGHRAWLTTVSASALLFAGTGHAAATLCRRTKSVAAGEDARLRLTKAVDQLDPTSHARAAALCLAQLAALHLESGELDAGLFWGERLLETSAGVRSNRLVEQLRAVRAAAAAHRSEPAIEQLDAGLEAMLPVRLPIPTGNRSDRPQ